MHLQLRDSYNRTALSEPLTIAAIVASAGAIASVAQDISDWVSKAGSWIGEIFNPTGAEEQRYKELYNTCMANNWPQRSEMVLNGKLYGIKDVQSWPIELFPKFAVAIKKEIDLAESKAASGGAGEKRQMARYIRVAQAFLAIAQSELNKRRQAAVAAGATPVELTPGQAASIKKAVDNQAGGTSLKSLIVPGIALGLALVRG